MTIAKRLRSSDKITIEGGGAGCIVVLMVISLAVLLFFGASWILMAGLGYLHTTGLLPVVVTFWQAVVILGLLVMVASIFRGGSK